MQIAMLSLGAWCRPAYQIQNYTNNRIRVQRQSSPFDWTITPFFALNKIIGSDLENTSKKILEQGIVSSTYAAECVETGLIFQHAMPVEKLELKDFLEVGHRLPKTNQTQEALYPVIQKFRHTLSNLERLKSAHIHPVFVRWVPPKRQDALYENVFMYETSPKLISLLHDFLGHEHFSLIRVHSEISSEVHSHSQNRVYNFQISNNLIECTILERPGHNGDGTQNFRGDDLSWFDLFDSALLKLGLYSAPLLALSRAYGHTKNSYHSTRYTLGAVRRNIFRQ